MTTRKDKRGNKNRRRKRIGAAMLAAVLLLGTSGIWIPVRAERQEESEIISWQWENTPEGLIYSEENGRWELKVPFSSEEGVLTRDSLEEMLPDKISAEVQIGKAEEISEESGETVTPEFEPQDTPTPMISDGEEEPPAETEIPADISEADEISDLTPTPTLTPTPEINVSEEEIHLDVIWNLSSYPEEGSCQGEYMIEAEIADEYQLAEGTEKIQIAVVLETEKQISDQEREILENHILKDLPATPGTTIDAFDYWQNAQDTPDDNNETEYWKKGINNNHYLLFGRNMYDNGVGYSPNGWNQWTGGGKGPREGIVAPTFGEDGFPRLALDDPMWDKVNDSKLDGSSTESLQYLFNPSITHEGKASYPNVNGLLQVDDEGYFYYDSARNYASLEDGNGQHFVLYDREAVNKSGSSPNGQFFPFNKGEEVFEVNADDGTISAKNVQSLNPIMNHYFGLHMQTTFYQQNKGCTSALDAGGKEVTYEFSGDDDVWIFIDGVLVADLGGIHDAVKVNINFHTGDITIESDSTANHNYTGKKTTLWDQFTAASSEGKTAWRGNTFADETYHKLDFFYLERGHTDSNMDLKFNLVTIPESSVIKVDQMGNTLPGVSFSLYCAQNENGTYTEKGDPIATGTTDNKGTFIFKDTENPNKNLGLEEIFKEYCGSSGGDTVYLILKEEQVPEGYRSSGEIWLRLTEYNGNVVLLGSNQWDTGAYASSGVYVAVSDNTVTDIEGNKHNLEETGEDGKDVKKGTLFAVPVKLEHDDTGGLTKKGHIITGNVTEGWTTHSEAESLEEILEVLQSTENSYSVFTKGSSGAYETTISDLPGDITKYYYMQEEDEKQNAEYTVAYYYTEADSVSEATVGNTCRIQSDPLKRVFSTNIYVPNIKNTLLVQKLDEAGNALNGAGFALYNENDIIIDNDGFTVSETAEPVMKAVTENHTEPLDLKGGIIFGDGQGEILPEGEYYLVETDPPKGYVKITAPIHILVNDNGVFADAGQKDDGVVVQRGMGSIVKSMLQFAANDDVDATLNHMMARFYITERLPNTDFVWRCIKGSTFMPGDAVKYIPAYYKSENKYYNYNPDKNADQQDLSPLHMEYDAEKAVLEYTAGEVFKGEMAEGQTAEIVQETDTGWSYLMMEQCGEHIERTGAPYTDLTGDNLTDLTNLFSGTVLVKVTNRRSGELTIEKKVQPSADPVEALDENSPLAKAAFDFRLTLNSSDNISGKSYRYTVSKGENGQESGSIDFKQKEGESGYIIGGVTLDSEADSAFVVETESEYVIRLKHGEKLTVYGLPYNIGYSIEELASDAFHLSGITVNGEQKQLSGNTVTGTIMSESIVFTNMPEGSITITKRDGEGKMLMGAEFALYEYREDGKYEEAKPVADPKPTEKCIKQYFDKNVEGYDPVRKRVTVSGEDGKQQTYIVHTGENGGLYYYKPYPEGDSEADAEAIVEFSGLDITRKYVIVETTVPDGYSKIDPISGFDIDGNGTVDGNEKTGITLPVVKGGDSTYNIAVSVTNRKGVELPNSGQFGPVIYIMAGADLAGGGAAFLLWQKQRKRRKH